MPSSTSTSVRSYLAPPALTRVLLVWRAGPQVRGADRCCASALSRSWPHTLLAAVTVSEGRRLRPGRLRCVHSMGSVAPRAAALVAVPSFFAPL